MEPDKLYKSQKMICQIACAHVHVFCTNRNNFKTAAVESAALGLRDGPSGHHSKMQILLPKQLSQRSCPAWH